MAKLTQFKVTNFRNILDSDWIDVGKVTALIGQNEAGKSNLCEALFRLYPFDDSKYDLDFDWPVDLWEKKDPKAIVCRARFVLSTEEGAALLAALQPPTPKPDPQTPDTPPPSVERVIKIDAARPIIVELSRDYAGGFFSSFENISGKYQHEAAWKAVSAVIPRFVYIFDYDLSGQTIELPHLAQRLQQVGYAKLTSEEQTIKIILDLAKVNIGEFLRRGETPTGRTLRSYDKRQASAFLTRKFQELWKQKKVEFDIDIDGPTLNIFVQDVGFSMPVRLDRRSTGFRWYVSFAWRFTHATAGEFKNVVLLLEEPGIHLHPAGQHDLVQFFDELGQNNQVIYTTHLPYMIDTGTPERVRIVEVLDHHTKITKGIVSSSRQPMMVIEAALGLSPSMSDLLGHRSTLIVEGTDDFVILNKLSGVFSKSGKDALPPEAYLWPAHGASKSPMYAGFLIGHGWKGGVLLDSDNEGRTAAKKIKDLYGPALSGFPILTLGPAIGEEDASIAIEDLLPRRLYLDCVSAAYRIKIEESELVDADVRPISIAVEELLKARGFSGLDKPRVLGELLRIFDTWNVVGDLPPELNERASALFKKIRESFVDGGKLYV
jgi:energy-coupling factor transporter ATP-binding protein EcfA2